MVDEVIDSFTDTTLNDKEFIHRDSSLNKLDLTINAVCRITLINGKVVEGLISLASGGSANGFYFRDAESKDWPFSPVLKLSLYLEKFERLSSSNYNWYKDRRIVNWRVTKDTIHIENVHSLSYLHWGGNSRIGTTEKLSIRESNDGSILEISNTAKNKVKYELRDSLTVFQELMPDTYLREGFHLPVIKVRVSEIASFQLLDKPGQKWLAKIQKNRAQSNNEFMASGKAGFNQKSNWYHLIIRNTALTKYIQDSLDLEADACGGFGEN